MPPLHVAAHGGAGSPPAHSDATQRAVALVHEEVAQGADLIDAVCRACALLEDDPRLNAGTGSSLRLDGHTIEMDAAVAHSDGRYGAVAALRRVRNPVLVARAVAETPHLLLAGDGALRFARRHGHPDHDPVTSEARAKYERFRARLSGTGDAPFLWGWDRAGLRANWNYDLGPDDILGPSDTVGVVASDGDQCVGALSTGGGIAQLIGRVGDVPLPGCGLHAGPAGAVAATGEGEHIARQRLADRVYGWLQQGVDARSAAARAIALFPASVDVGLIIATPRGTAGASNRPMAWSHQTIERPTAR